MAASETKKRLLLSKWRDEQEAGREQQDEHEEALTERDWQIFELESALLDVRYWLHDGLVHHRLVSDPRRLLRKVEDALS